MKSYGFGLLVFAFALTVFGPETGRAVTASAAPSFNPVAGTYNNDQSITLSSLTPGATICYRLDGVAPTAGTPGTCDAPAITYSSPVAITVNNTTIRALSTKVGNSNASSSATYILTAGPPTFSPTAGTYATAQSVTVNDVTSGATICYRVDGTNPAATTPGSCDVGSITYAGPIAVNSTKTLLVIATKANNNNSTVSSGLFTISASSSRKRVRVVQ